MYIYMILYLILYMSNITCNIGYMQYTQDGIRWPEDDLGCPHRSCKSPQRDPNGPKRTQRGSKRPPRSPKSLPAASQDPQKTSRRLPKCFQETSQASIFSLSNIILVLKPLSFSKHLNFLASKPLIVARRNARSV